MAPDIDQFQVINHFNGDKIESSRNILVEASRISRGDIISVDKVSRDELDALIFPVGMGIAKVLQNMSRKGKVTGGFNK